MKFNIYDWANRIAKIEIKEKNLQDIDRIEVEVITGDEVVKVFFKDGESEVFDSSDLCKDIRIIDYFDGKYILIKEKEIEEWIKLGENQEVFEIGKCTGLSYKRMEKFM